MEKMLGIHFAGQTIQFNNNNLIIYLLDMLESGQHSYFCGIHLSAVGGKNVGSETPSVEKH